MSPEKAQDLPPGASPISGVPPPVEHQFKPGFDPRRNAGGRPKGALPRTAWLREIARNEDEDGIGQGAIELAKRVATLTRELTLPGADVERITTELKALLALFAEAEGRPQERVEHSGSMMTISIQGELAPEDVDPP